MAYLSGAEVRKLLDETQDDQYGPVYAVACAPCHDQGAASVCVTCHRVGGSGGTPHPPGWSDAHPRADISRNGMCLICHP